MTAFEKETTASGQRSVLSKIQHGLIAAQDIGDDKLVTVQAMSDLIENKSRQLDHDSKNLNFGKDDEDEPVQASTKAQQNTSTNNPSNTSTSSAKNTPTSSAKPSKDKETKESASNSTGKGQVKRRSNKKPHGGGSDSRSSRGNPGGGNTSTNAEDREDDEVSTVSSRSGSTRPRGNAGGGNKRQGVKRKSTGKRSSNFADKGDDSDREVDLSNMDIDPDEPRYCLCDQVGSNHLSKIVIIFPNIAITEPRRISCLESLTDLISLIRIVCFC